MIFQMICVAWKAGAVEDDYRSNSDGSGGSGCEEANGRSRGKIHGIESLNICASH